LLMTDRTYLRWAIELSERSQEPLGCGCVIVLDEEVVGEAFNSQRTDEIAVNHAEIKALIVANEELGSRLLEGATAYCSCQPCSMCLSALSFAKVERIVFAKLMIELAPDDRLSRMDPYEFVKQLNFVPKLEQLLL